MRKAKKGDIILGTLAGGAIIANKFKAPNSMYSIDGQVLKQRMIGKRTILPPKF